MVSRGPNTNGSQFIITFQPCSEYDGKYTVFGRVISGLDDLCENVKEDSIVTIVDCGQMNQKIVEL